jgi:hypothetical protein
MAAEQVSPYTPSFGMVPYVLAGRAELLEEHVNGLRSGATRRARRPRPLNVDEWTRHTITTKGRNPSN